MATDCRMKLFVLLIACIAAINAVTLKQDWESFKIKHGKEYISESEELLRFKIFRQNRQVIDQHNKRYNLGKETFYMGVNEYSDLSQEEFRHYLTNANYSQGINDESDGEQLSVPEEVELPSCIDWRAYGAVTAIENQGMCGSCWAFAANAGLESHYILHKKKVVILSEQNLIDCSRNYGNNGCNGGSPRQAYKYIRDNHGIDGDSSYPYKANDGTCHYDSRYSKATVCGHWDTKKGSESDLKYAVGTYGPVIIGMHVSAKFQSYKGGLFWDSQCDGKDINHAMLVVGYGNDGKYDYWLVKNSWGTSWGENGYIKMIRNYNNNCKIASDPCFPRLCE